MQTQYLTRHVCVLKLSHFWSPAKSGLGKPAHERVEKDGLCCKLLGKSFPHTQNLQSILLQQQLNRSHFSEHIAKPIILEDCNFFGPYAFW